MRWNQLFQQRVSLTLALSLTCAAVGPAQPPAESSTTIDILLPAALRTCPGSAVAPDSDVDRRSIYVPAADGVKLAVDIFLPKGLTPGTRLPTLYSATRYWRGQKGAPIATNQALWIARGFAVVNADVRGTGASFGQWYIDYTPREAMDIGYLANWIVTQPWSNGQVVMTGTSSPGTMTLIAPAYGAPAIKAIAPKFIDFDSYTDLTFPGGVVNEGMDVAWGLAVRKQDLNEPRTPGSPGVRPVDGPDGEAQLAAAVEDHKLNPWSIDQIAYQVIYKDEPLSQFGGMPIDASGTFQFQDAIGRSRVPIFGWGGWLDAGIGQGMLSRFMTWTNPQLMIIGPWNHGARADVNVFSPNRELELPMAAQDQMVYCFLSNYVGDRPRRLADHTLIYYIMGEDKWKETTVWPIPGTRQDRFYLDAGDALSKAPPKTPGRDRYTVDFAASTGPANRWNQGTRVNYGDRAIPDRKLLVYTSTPVTRDMEVTGQPVITLRVASSHTDGNFIVYLEDVAPDGSVTYLTEGELRALHRKLSNAKPPYRTTYPYRSYSFHDAELLVPGRTATLTFQLMATSVLVKAGHAIRIAIAGADSGTFLRIPARAQGDVTITVSRGGAAPSFIDLPVVPARAALMSRPRRTTRGTPS